MTVAELLNKMEEASQLTDNFLKHTLEALTDMKKIDLKAIELDEDEVDEFTSFFPANIIEPKKVFSVEQVNALLQGVIKAQRVA